MSFAYVLRKRRFLIYEKWKIIFVSNNRKDIPRDGIVPNGTPYKYLQNHHIANIDFLDTQNKSSHLLCHLILRQNWNWFSDLLSFLLWFCVVLYMYLYKTLYYWLKWIQSRFMFLKHLLFDIFLNFQLVIYLAIYQNPSIQFW